MASTPPQTAAARRPVHAVTVVAAEQVTPNMRRLTFAGDALTGMAAPLPAQWLKVIAPGPDGVTRVNRAYTIRKLDAERGALDIDFVLHGEAGPVSAWACSSPRRSWSGPARRWSSETPGAAARW